MMDVADLRGCVMPRIVLRLLIATLLTCASLSAGGCAQTATLQIHQAAIQRDELHVIAETATSTWSLFWPEGLRNVRQYRLRYRLAEAREPVLLDVATLECDPGGNREQDFSNATRTARGSRRCMSFRCWLCARYAA